MDKHPKWEDLDLESFRQMADPAVDDLVEALIPEQGSESIGRLGYNAMLMLADKLGECPELTVIPDSRLARQLSKMPKALVDYFDPMEAPDWVDPQRLQLGSSLWRDNTLITLIALYSASLPACYLMKNGIPALYQTEKLREHQYIFQRIYETGLMLAATMDQDGIKIIDDTDFEDDKLFLKALQHLDRAGHWQKQGRCFCRTGESEAPEIAPQQLHAEIERLRGKPKRYIWGKGYLTAKKVRFLHASMRFMLTQPARCPPCGNKDHPQSLAEVMSRRETPWDAQKFGVPVNQEDLAYTLLTFGLVIPEALSKWGLPVAREQKEAFLHLWRLVGHIMGVRPELLTDDWDEAKALFLMIQQRQAGASDEGAVLTEALMGFLGDYLPHAPGLAHRLSAALIIGQLGLKNAAYLLDETLIKETTCFWRKPIYAIAGILFKSYFFFRTRYFNRFKHLGGITTYRLHQASELLIDSWRDGYTRSPFFVPADATTWVRKPGFDTAFSKRVTQWRRKLFIGLGTSISFLVLAVFSLASSLPSGLLGGWPALQASLTLAGISWLIALALMHLWLPVIYRNRPQLHDKIISD
ncbi:MAG: oxygenase MpaB family protein [Gammaproteobacteria bacterium]